MHWINVTIKFKFKQFIFINNYSTFIFKRNLNFLYIWKLSIVYLCSSSYVNTNELYNKIWLITLLLISSNNWTIQCGTAFINNVM